MWVPPGATAADLVRVYVTALRYRGKRLPGPSAIAAALGLHRNTVRVHRAGEPPTYNPHWRPVRWELLPLRLPLPAKILASHIARRPPPAPGAYLPTVKDYATDLGWTIWRARSALRHCLAAGVVREEIREKRGASCRRVRRFVAPSCTIPAPVVAQSPPPSLHNSRPRGCTIPAPVPVVPVFPIHPSRDTADGLAAFLGRLPPMDGWETVLQPETRLCLETGPHAPSLFACLTGAGVFQDDPRARWRLAGESAGGGWRTGDLLGLISRAFRGRRVRNPAALLRVWLERDQREKIPAAPRYLVGSELRETLERADREDTEEIRTRERFELATARARESLERLGLDRHGRKERYRELAKLLEDRLGIAAAMLARERAATLPQLVALIAANAELCGDLPPDLRSLASGPRARDDGPRHGSG